MRRLIKIICLFVCAVLLNACSPHDKNVLRVGTISGPETDLMQTAKQVAKNKYHLNVDIVEFTDYVEPNAALNDGSIDANMFQHKPYLDQQIKDRHYKLIPIGKTFIYPVGIYSTKIKNIKDIPSGSTVALPNDPSNEARALLLLQKAKLIKLKSTAGVNATPIDIQENPKKLIFKELDAAQLPRSLADVTLAVINTNYAVAAGLSPTHDAIFREDKDSPYVNLIVIREDEINDPRMKQFVAAFQSPEVIDAANKIFKDQAIPGW
jgi:D-methionine transport system substrate-binding protein